MRKNKQKSIIVDIVPVEIGKRVKIPRGAKIISIKETNDSSKKTPVKPPFVFADNELVYKINDQLSAIHHLSPDEVLKIGDMRYATKELTRKMPQIINKFEAIKRAYE